MKAEDFVTLPFEGSVQTLPSQLRLVPEEPAVPVSCSGHGSCVALLS